MILTQVAPRERVSHAHDRHRIKQLLRLSSGWFATKRSERGKIMNRLLIKLCLFLLVGIVYACFLHPPTACSQVQGFVKNREGQSLADVRITVDNGFTTCSDSSGWYSLRVTGIPCKATCKRQEYKLQPTSLDGNALSGTISDVFLDKATPQRELRGSVGDKKEGVTVKLYKKERDGYHPVLLPDDGITVTCADGMYSFSELSNGIYQIVPECSVCTFSPQNSPDIEMPNRLTPEARIFNFTAQCKPGACQKK